MSYHYVSRLSHLGITTSVPQEPGLLHGRLGLQVSDRGGPSVWLRAWGEFVRHSLKLTEGHDPGLVMAATGRRRDDQRHRPRVTDRRDRAT
jgi:catechol 2,3-dioxygenase